jgi:Tfp pilus assembly protein PilN
MRQQLNFFSPYIKKEKLSPLKRTAVVFLFVFLIIIASYGVLQVRLMMIKKSIDDKKEILANYTEIELQYLAETKQKVDNLLIFQEQMKKTEYEINNIDYLGYDLLEKFFANVPVGITFDNLSLTRSEWHLTGTADSRVAIAEFEHNLRSDGRFGAFRLPSISPTENRFSFSLSGTFDKGALKREN